jgi:hypothetical protein
MRVTPMVSTYRTNFTETDKDRADTQGIDSLEKSEHEEEEEEEEEEVHSKFQQN